jgi:inosine-uridine nucleoside N-ribohydrolase
MRQRLAALTPACAESDRKKGTRFTLPSGMEASKSKHSCKRGTRTVKRLRITSILFLSIVFVVVTNGSAQTPPQRVIIDTDPGIDDAMAILLALNSPELKVEALTVVPGNVEAAQGLENALKLVSLAGRCDVLVAGGAQHPLNQKLITAQFWHGRNGLAGVDLPAPKCKPDARFGPDLIIEMAHKYPHQITLIPVGPLTNIALAVSKDPGIASLVKDVVIMGGSITGGNVNGAAEANIYNDPEAAQIVFNAGWTVTMIGSDVGERTLMTRKYLNQLQANHAPESDFIAKLGDFYLTRSEKSGYQGAAMYDPLAVAVVIDPTLVTLKNMHVDVETKGEFTRGETVANRMGYDENNVLHGDHYEIEGLVPLKPNARVCLASDSDRFLRLFVDRIMGSK